MKKDTIIIGILCILLILGSIFFLGYQKNRFVGQEEITLTKDTSSDIQTDSASSDSDIKTDSYDSEMAVYVSGAVKHPGLFRFHGKARVSDAIDAVGGFCKNASTDSINMARILKDGEQIHIMTLKQAKAARKRGNASSKTSSDKDGLININQATKEELMQLPGIGESKALAIIAYREEHGDFQTTKDLMQISGIKEGVYNKIKDFITIL